MTLVVLKNVFAYYLLLLYGFTSVKPIFPAIYNWWSHEFYEAEHLSEVHARYGSHHLDKEIRSAASDQEQQKSHSPKADDQVYFHIVPATLKQGSIAFASGITYPHFILSPLSSACLPPNGPPPRN